MVEDQVITRNKEGQIHFCLEMTSMVTSLLHSFMKTEHLGPYNCLRIPSLIIIAMVIKLQHEGFCLGDMLELETKALV